MMEHRFNGRTKQGRRLSGRSEEVFLSPQELERIHDAHVVDDGQWKPRGVLFAYIVLMVLPWAVILYFAID